MLLAGRRPSLQRPETRPHEVSVVAVGRAEGVRESPRGGRLIRAAGEMNLETDEFVKNLRFVVRGKGRG